MKKAFHIYTVSDATGELANNLAVSAIGQFPQVKVKIVRRPRITTERDIRRVTAEAKKVRGVILFTMVSHDVRRRVLSEAKKEGVVAMDIMGPVLDMLSHYFHTLPSDEPGLQYKVTRDYYKRTEAVDFAVRHDDGLGLESLHEADIVILGISRTSKTPLSIYLAFQGYRCANIPIVKGIPLPSRVFDIDPGKRVGLIISPDKLAGMRSTRLKKMGRPETEHYAQMEHISEELNYAREIFRALGEIPVIDVTGKAIEETAAEILHELKL